MTNTSKKLKKTIKKTSILPPANASMSSTWTLSLYKGVPGFADLNATYYKYKYQDLVDAGYLDKFRQGPLPRFVASPTLVIRHMLLLQKPKQVAALVRLGACLHLPIHAYNGFQYLDAVRVATLSDGVAGGTDMLQVLRDEGVALHDADFFGRTPLHYAMSENICRLLLAAGADPEATDKAGQFADQTCGRKARAFLYQCRPAGSKASLQTCLPPAQARLLRSAKRL